MYIICLRIIQETKTKLLNFSWRMIRWDVLCQHKARSRHLAAFRTFDCVAEPRGSDWIGVAFDSKHWSKLLSASNRMATLSQQWSAVLRTFIQKSRSALAFGCGGTPTPWRALVMQRQSSNFTVGFNHWISQDRSRLCLFHGMPKKDWWPPYQMFGVVNQKAT